MPSPQEVLRFIAEEEDLERTLARFPGLSREGLRELLLQARPVAWPEAAPAPVLSLPPPGMLRIFTDGAARGNPGPAGGGAVLVGPEGKVLSRVGRFLGTATNNFAEYQGLLLGLREALRQGAARVQVCSDSELMIRQLQGKYKVRSETLRPLFDEAVSLLRRFERAELRHVPREENHLADEMSNRAIDERL